MSTYERSDVIEDVIAELEGAREEARIELRILGEFHPMTAAMTQVLAGLDQSIAALKGVLGQ